MSDKNKDAQGNVFRKKPVEVEAIQWNGKKFDATPPQWFCDAMYAFGKPGFLMRFNDDIVIETLEGQMKASPGDWIIRGVKGEIYPCKSDIFELTYEHASQVSAAAPADSIGNHRPFLNAAHDYRRFGNDEFLQKLIATADQFRASEGQAQTNSAMLRKLENLFQAEVGPATARRLIEVICAAQFAEKIDPGDEVCEECRGAAHHSDGSACMACYGIGTVSAGPAAQQPGSDRTPYIFGVKPPLSIAAQQSLMAGGAVPDGYMLVPTEPTGVMKDVGANNMPFQSASPANAATVYRAMIAAAAPLLQVQPIPAERTTTSTDARDQAHTAGWNACRLAVMLGMAPQVQPSEALDDDQWGWSNEEKGGA